MCVVWPALFCCFFSEGFATPPSSFHHSYLKPNAICPQSEEELLLPAADANSLLGKRVDARIEKFVDLPGSNGSRGRVAKLVTLSPVKGFVALLKTPRVNLLTTGLSVRFMPVAVLQGQSFDGTGENNCESQLFVAQNVAVVVESTQPLGLSDMARRSEDLLKRKVVVNGRINTFMDLGNKTVLVGLVESDDTASLRKSALPLIFAVTQSRSSVGADVEVSGTLSFSFPKGVSATGMATLPAIIQRALRALGGQGRPLVVITDATLVEKNLSL